MQACDRARDVLCCSTVHAHVELLVAIPGTVRSLSLHAHGRRAPAQRLRSLFERVGPGEAANTAPTRSRELRRHGVLASMGSVADCFDDALAESVFATLECELFDQQPGGRFTTRRAAKLAVFDYLETFYNPRRRHSAPGQIAPATFEARHTLNTAA